jgi:MFS superfamily sulfate permease-like transporter
VFALAVVLSGVIQILFGLLRGGAIVQYVPSPVIKGMLAAIGILLILKQIPHAMGYDKEDVARISIGFSNSEEVAGAMSHAVAELEGGAVVLALVSMGILLLWEKNATLKDLYYLPGPLVAVLVALGGNYLVTKLAPGLPEGGAAGFYTSLHSPSWGAVLRADVWGVAVTVAIVASLETLLNVEAIDKLDPFHRQSPTNRELVAQGLANTVSGLFGGLPVTSVVVRSTAGLAAGGRTRVLAVVHGVLMLGAVLFAAKFLNMLPLACLAGILLMTGYKLAKPAVFKAMYAMGTAQFVPFVVTVVGTVATDLLRGVAIGLLTSVFFTVRRSLGRVLEVIEEGEQWTIRLLKEAPFYARARMTEALERVPAGTRVIVDAANADFIDHDVLDAIAAFERTAQQKNIEVIVRKPAPQA